MGLRLNTDHGRRAASDTLGRSARYANSLSNLFGAAREQRPEGQIGFFAFLIFEVTDNANRAAGGSDFSWACQARVPSNTTSTRRNPR